MSTGKWLEIHQGKGWVESLSEVVFQMNTSVSATTGVQPYEAVFGQKACINERLLESLADQGLINEEEISKHVVIGDKVISVDQIDPQHDKPVPCPTVSIPEVISVDHTDPQHDQPAPCPTTAETILEQPGPSHFLDTRPPVDHVQQRTDQPMPEWQDPTTTLDSSTVVSHPAPVASADSQAEPLADPSPHPPPVTSDRLSCTPPPDTTQIPTMTDVVLGFGVNDQQPDRPDSPRQATPIVPVLTSMTTPNRKRASNVIVSEPHNKIRRIAVDNFMKAANRQQINFDRQKGGMPANFEKGDTIGLRIPKIDRTPTCMKFLPCKILKVCNNNRYTLYTPNGILNTTFSHSDFIDMRNIQYTDLQNTDPNTLQTISDTAAYRSSSHWQTLPSSRNICKCSEKGQCKTARCPCKKSGNACSTKCHTGHQCLNKHH